MANTKKVIGISGTNGSGKDTLGRALALRHNFLFVSVTDLLREEARRRGLAIERENLRMISAEWRRQYGYGVLVDRAYSQFQELADKYDGLAIASLRNPHEADRVHELGGIVIWVDANARTRYERIQRNLAERGRDSEDEKTFEQFMVEEEMEMHTPPGGDDANLNMAAVKTRSDLVLNNDATNLQEFETFIDEQLFDPQA
jgi:cytidylate kinase